MVCIIFSLCLRLFKGSMDAVKETTKIIKLSWLIFWQPTFHMFEKEPGKWIYYTKSRLSENPPLKKSIKQNKTKTRKWSKQKLVLKTFVFRVCLEKFGRNKLKKKRIANQNKTNHQKIYSNWPESFVSRNILNTGCYKPYLSQNLIS